MSQDSDDDSFQPSAAVSKLDSLHSSHLHDLGSLYVDSHWKANVDDAEVTPHNSAPQSGFIHASVTIHNHHPAHNSSAMDIDVDTPHFVHAQVDTAGTSRTPIDTPSPASHASYYASFGLTQLIASDSQLLPTPLEPTVVSTVDDFFPSASTSSHTPSGSADTAQTHVAIESSNDLAFIDLHISQFTRSASITNSVPILPAGSSATPSNRSESSSTAPSTTADPFALSPLPGLPNSVSISASSSISSSTEPYSASHRSPSMGSGHSVSRTVTDAIPAAERGGQIREQKLAGPAAVPPSTAQLSKASDPSFYAASNSTAHSAAPTSHSQETAVSGQSSFGASLPGSNAISGPPGPRKFQFPLLQTDFYMDARLKPNDTEPRDFDSLWDSHHLKFPCSYRNRCYLPNDPYTAYWKWQYIASKLQAVNSIESLETAIRSYNPTFSPYWSRFSLLSMLAKSEKSFVSHTLPYIIHMALNLPKFFREPLPLLLQQRNATVTLSQKQCVSLIANMFLCTWPRRLPRKGRWTNEYSNFPSVSFESLFTQTDEDALAKLRCFACYFEFHRTNQDVDSPVTIRRQVVRAETLPVWSHCNAAMSRCIVVPRIGLEHCVGQWQADFANKEIGGGVLGHGTVQEEIRFSISPELLVSRLLCQEMQQNEAVLISGSQIYAKTHGYSRKFRYDQPHYDQDVLQGRYVTQVIAFDAVNYKNEPPRTQFQAKETRRELEKAFAAFSVAAEEERAIPVATGKWGCGVFGGNVAWKFLIQWIAASASGRACTFCTLDDTLLETKLTGFLNFVDSLQRRPTVREIYQIMSMWSPATEEDDSVLANICHVFTSQIAAAPYPLMIPVGTYSQDHGAYGDGRVNVPEKAIGLAGYGGAPPSGASLAVGVPPSHHSPHSMQNDFSRGVPDSTRYPRSDWNPATVGAFAGPQSHTQEPGSSLQQQHQYHYHQDQGRGLGQQQLHHVTVERNDMPGSAHPIARVGSYAAEPANSVPSMRYADYRSAERELSMHTGLSTQNFSGGPTRSHHVDPRSYHQDHPSSSSSSSYSGHSGHSGHGNASFEPSSHPSSLPPASPSLIPPSSSAATPTLSTQPPNILQ